MVGRWSSCAFLMLAGCYQSTFLSEEPSSDAGRRDALVFDVPRVDPGDATLGDAVGDDVLRPMDASVDGGACPPQTATVIFDETVVAGRTTTIGVGVGPGCYCGNPVGCSVDRAGGRLSITTTHCPSLEDCDACELFARGQCEIPPLEEGLWEVRVNDSVVFALTSTASDLTGPSAQTGRAEPDYEWPPQSLGPATGICYPSVTQSGIPFLLDVHQECGVCAMLGPCTVRVDGSDLVVTTSDLVYSGDGDCDLDCRPLMEQCVAPGIPAGDYAVHLDGRFHGRLSVRDGGPDGPITCGELDG